MSIICFYCQNKASKDCPNCQARKAVDVGRTDNGTVVFTTRRPDGMMIVHENVMTAHELYQSCRQYIEFYMEQDISS